jgi:hypothetical protein
MLWLIPRIRTPSQISLCVGESVIGIQTEGQQVQICGSEIQSFYKGGLSRNAKITAAQKQESGP